MLIKNVMIGLDIPQEDFIKLIELIELSENQFNEIANQLIDLPLGVNTSQIADLLVKTSIKNAEKFAEIILKLFISIAQQEEMPVEYIINGLFQSYKENIEQININENEFSKRINLLLELSKPIVTSYKIVSARRDYGNLIDFIDLSWSINPIFNDGKNLIGSTLIQKLKISFEDKDENETEISFVLDKDDIDKLKLIIEQAETNSQKIEKQLANTELKNIDF